MQFQPELIWFLAGLALAFLEFMAPGVVLVFFAAGAWITALTTWFGLTESIAWQMIVFAASSVALLVVLRRRFRSRFLGHATEPGNPMTDLDEFIGHETEVVEAIQPDRPGRVEFKGASWTAAADRAIAPGQRAVILRVDGLTLHVTPVTPISNTEEETHS